MATNHVDMTEISRAHLRMDQIDENNIAQEALARLRETAAAGASNLVSTMDELIDTFSRVRSQLSHLLTLWRTRKLHTSPVEHLGRRMAAQGLEWLAWEYENIMHDIHGITGNIDDFVRESGVRSRLEGRIKSNQASLSEVFEAFRTED